MPDRESVIKGLEICEKKDCVLCPYKDEKDETYSGFCEQVLKQDALALLKDQEPVEAVDDPDDPLLAFCGECEHTLGFKKIFNYCPYCGKAVKWND